MTVIVGIQTNEAVYIGADSVGVAGHLKQQSANPKVFQNGPMLIGYTSSFRMGQLIEHVLQVPEHPEDMPTMRYMVSVFIPALRKCLVDGGYTRIESNQEVGGCFLVGYLGRLFDIQPDFQVHEYADGYAATGSGQDFALAAIYGMTKDWGKRPFKGVSERDAHSVIECAIKAAEKFCTSVEGPVQIMRLPIEGRKKSFRHLFSGRV